MFDRYRFELLTLTSEELGRVSVLLRTVFRGARHLTPDYLRWQYLDNPDGRAVGCNAWLDDALVGHMTAVPMRGRIEGEEMPGLFMLNGAVLPEHRGRKLQSRISAAIFDESVRRGYAFCIGTGNKYSTGPLLTRFELVRPLEARIGFGPLRRHPTAAAPSFERIWSEEALRWRLDNPERRYSVRGGHLLAPTGWPGIAAILHDHVDLADSDGPAPGPMRVWIGLDPGVDWRRSRFAAIPARLRPSPLNLVFKDLAGGDTLPDPHRFAFRAIDFDPY